MSVRSTLPSVTWGRVLGFRGVREIALIGALYVFYTVTRTFAEDDLGPAQDRAGDLKHLEQIVHLDWEHALNNWLVSHHTIGLLSCYWYATAHYLVTLTVLIWLFRKGTQAYTPARWVLVVSCLIALACYLLLPTAPPRLTGGYVDVMSLHSNAGWWGADASAPKGMGNLTNELAAFPSLHAGWALWVALVVRRNTGNYWVRGLAWVHALITALVVVGTGNHWIIDVIAGWAVVIVAMWLVDPWFADKREAVRARMQLTAQRLDVAPLPPPADETTDHPGPRASSGSSCWPQGRP